MQNFNIMFFSPTGSTKKIAYCLVKLLEANGSVEIFDITKLQNRIEFKTQTLSADHLFILTPVYSHRIPTPVSCFFKKSFLQYKKATIIITYGNANEGYALWQTLKLLKRAYIKTV